MSEAEPLHGKELQRGTAKRLIDCWHSTGGDPSRLLPPFTRLVPAPPPAPPRPPLPSPPPPLRSLPHR